MSTTWTITGQLSLNASVVVTGATANLGVSTSSTVSIPKGDQGWITVSASFDKTKWIATNPTAAFTVSWTAHVE
jgi:hypothetical protein